MRLLDFIMNSVCEQMAEENRYVFELKKPPAGQVVWIDFVDTTPASVKLMIADRETFEDESFDVELMDTEDFDDTDIKILREAVKYCAED